MNKMRTKKKKREWKMENKIYSQCNWTVISFSTGLISCDPCARHKICVPKYVRGTERIRILLIMVPAVIDWWMAPGISSSFRHQDTFGVGMPPLTWHDKKNSWPSRNGPATVVISLPCVSNIRGSSGGTGRMKFIETRHDPGKRTEHEKESWKGKN